GVPPGDDKGPAPRTVGVPEPAARTRGQLGSASVAAVGNSSSQQASLLLPTRAAALPAGTRSAVRQLQEGTKRPRPSRRPDPTPSASLPARSPPPAAADRPRSAA
ncbi:Hypothetical predicted protein, partial [Marmota monax]